jgi:hypothetical protein
MLRKGNAFFSSSSGTHRVAFVYNLMISQRRGKDAWIATKANGTYPCSSVMDDQVMMKTITFKVMTST